MLLESTVTDHSVFVQLDISKNYFDFDEFSGYYMIILFEIQFGCAYIYYLTLTAACRLSPSCGLGAQ